jgi:tRNA threonylcarbamoyladenosine biosynthesis protein TsaB
MKLLAIDTSEDACSAALCVGDEILERFEIAPRRHTELILPMMDGLLAEAGLSLRGLDALAFARGPGSFTGIRIATSIVQGAALGAGLAVVPVSSLQALAQGARRLHGAGQVLSALDARMREVYWGAYRADDAGIMTEVVAEAVCAPEQVRVPEGGAWFCAGSAWAAYGDVLAERCGLSEASDSDARVHAQDVARVAARRFAAGGAVAAEQALPVYLRDEVAWAKRT